jgi:hypothetical protein
VTAYPRPDRPTQKTRPCLSPDYQVFIVSRMREAYDRTGSTPTAVVEGIGRTGRLKGKTRTSTNYGYYVIPAVDLVVSCTVDYPLECLLPWLPAVTWTEIAVSLEAMW